MMLAALGQMVFDIYRRCDGDADTMTDFFMETLMASTAHSLSEAPPLQISGQEVDGVDALRGLVRFKVCEAIAFIECQGRSQH